MKFNGIEVHKTVTAEAIAEACEEDINVGFCILCGAEHSCVEPDAENYKCESCGAEQVFGAEELLMAIA